MISAATAKQQLNKVKQDLSSNANLFLPELSRGNSLANASRDISKYLATLSISFRPLIDARMTETRSAPVWVDVVAEETVTANREATNRQDIDPIMAVAVLN
jgi:hypothetical protein